MIPADFLNGIAEGVFHGFDATTEYLDQGAEQVLESPYFQAAAVGIAAGGVGAGAIGLGGPLAISTSGGFFLSQGLQGLGVPWPIAGAIGGGSEAWGGISSTPSDTSESTPPPGRSCSSLSAWERSRPFPPAPHPWSFRRPSRAL